VEEKKIDTYQAVAGRLRWLVISMAWLRLVISLCWLDWNLNEECYANKLTNIPKTIYTFEN
jgi:hypothetical protein